jgi:hypothetical protein
MFTLVPIVMYFTMVPMLLEVVGMGNGKFGCASNVGLSTKMVVALIYAPGKIGGGFVWCIMNILEFLEGK